MHWNPGARAGARQPFPFDDLASRSLPTSMRDALLWAQAIAVFDATFSGAMQLLAAYFITEVEVMQRPGHRAPSGDEKQKWREFLYDRLEIKSQLLEALTNYLLLNNELSSVLAPHRSTLACGNPACGTTSPFRRVAGDPLSAFRYHKGTYTARCPVCRRAGPMRRDYHKGSDADGLVVKHWDPMEIDIKQGHYLGRCTYLWKVPTTFRSAIRGGDVDALEEADELILEAVTRERPIQFDPDRICHLKMPFLATFKTGGWGLPGSIRHFRQEYLAQSLRRMQEAVATEAVLPFRWLSPAPQAGATEAGDPLFGVNVGTFGSKVLAMYDRFRKDPGQLNWIGLPVTSGQFGGDANRLAPVQLLEYAEASMLNALGVPAEMYRGSMNLQALLPSMRLMEARHAHIPDGANRFLDFLARQVSERLGWVPVQLKLRRVQYTDDIQRNLAMLQLMREQMISATTGLRSLGLDADEERRRMIEEQHKLQEEQLEMQDEARGQEVLDLLGGAWAQAQQAGAQPQQAGAQPQQAGLEPPSGDRPEEIWQMAEQISYQLQQMPSQERRTELARLASDDELLHAAVKGLLERADRQLATAGKQQLQQQMQQQAQPAPPYANLMGAA